MTINTKGWCLKCPGCTQALQRATQQADQQFRELHPACTCDSDTGPPECPIATRCKEPLAWSIQPSDIKDQSTSHLYTIIPREIRDMIFTYALTDTTSNPVAQEPPQPQDAEGRRDRYYNTNTAKKFHPSDIAFNLLLACKAVYLETYLLPLRLNPLNIRALDQQMKKNRFQPWQYAQLSGLDIKLPQMALENGALRNLLRGWKAQARHDALHYVVPIEALIHDENIKLDKYPVSFNYIFIPASTATSSTADKRPQLLIDVLRRAELPESLIQPCSSHLRVVPANSLTHLTLRLEAKGWWTWSSSPDTISPHDQLRLDPTFSDNRSGVRGDTDLMEYLAAQRREGKHPELSNIKCWGKHVTSLLPDLRVLELVLETFQEKKEQVDVVAECATTWRFDLADGALVWDGEVVAKRWSRGVTGLRLPKDASWSDRCRNYEVRVVRFVRERA